MVKIAIIVVSVVLAGVFPLSFAYAQGGPNLTGKCVLNAAAKVAIDGSCGEFTAGEKELSADRKTISITTLINFEYLLRPETIVEPALLPYKIVYLCITSGHNSHDDDMLVVATTDKKNDPEHKCSDATPNAKACIMQSSMRDLTQCNKAAQNGGWLTDRETRWCLKRDKKGCRFLPLHLGQKLSVWITRLHPGITSLNRTAKGTWTIHN